MIFSDCRAPLSHTGVRHVRQIARVPARSPYQAVLLQLQRGFGSPDIQGSHGFRILRGPWHGVSCIEKGTNTFRTVPSTNTGVYQDLTVSLSNDTIRLRESVKSQLTLMLVGTADTLLTFIFHIYGRE